MGDEPKDLASRYPNLDPIEPGEKRNPTGINGATRLAMARKFLDEKAEPTSRKTRIENVLTAMYATSIDRRRRDHVSAGTVLLKYYLGLPPQAHFLSVTNDDQGAEKDPLELALEELVRRSKAEKENTILEVEATVKTIEDQ